MSSESRVFDEDRKSFLIITITYLLTVALTRLCSADADGDAAMHRVRVDRQIRAPCPIGPASISASCRNGYVRERERGPASDFDGTPFTGKVFIRHRPRPADRRAEYTLMQNHNERLLGEKGSS